MILVDTQRVVGQQLHPLNVADRMQIRTQLFQMGVGIRESGDYHMADPKGGVGLLHGGKELQKFLGGLSGNAAVTVRREVLDVQQNEVGIGQNFFIAAAAAACGVDAGVDACVFAQAQDLT